MQRFRSMRSLQKFTAVCASVCNYFNKERALYSKDNFKLNRAAALADVLPERVPADGLLILRDEEPGDPEVTPSPLGIEEPTHRNKEPT